MAVTINTVGLTTDQINVVNNAVEGPAGTVDNRIAVFDGATGKLLKTGAGSVTQVLDRANHTGTQLMSTISNAGTAATANLTSSASDTTAGRALDASHGVNLDGAQEINGIKTFKGDQLIVSTSTGIGTNKNGRFSSLAYNGDPFATIVSRCEAASNSVTFGGGTTTAQPATNILFKTKAGVGALDSGTTVMEVTPDLVSVTGAITATNSAYFATTLSSGNNVGVGRSDPTQVGANITTIEVSGRNATNGGALRLSSTDRSIDSYLYSDSAGLHLGTITNHNVETLVNSSVITETNSNGFDVTGAISATTGVTVATGQDVLANLINPTVYTPTMSGSGGSAGTFAASFLAEYHRTAKGMVARIRAEITDLGSWTGEVRISLPATVVSTSGVIATGAVWILQHTYDGQVTAVTSNGLSYASFKVSKTGSLGNYLKWPDLATTASNRLICQIEFTV
jgi:hypothetical protein